MWSSCILFVMSIAVASAYRPLHAQIAALRTQRNALRDITSIAATYTRSMEKFELPPLIAKKDGAVDELIHRICEAMRVSPIYIAPGEIDVSGLEDVLEARDSNSLLVIDDSELVAKATVQLRKARAVYVMKEGVKIDQTARKASLYDLWLPSDDRDSSTMCSYAALLKRLGTAPTTKDTLLDAGIWSHFVSLTFPSIDDALPSLPALRIGADAFELRVDLLSDISTSSLHRQIALLRKSCPLPIVFTVRSVGQIGKFPDDTPEEMFNLLREGLRAGCEWIDVEACWDDDYIDSLTSLAQKEYSSTSRLLGSLHVTVPQSENQIASLFEKTKLKNAAHMLKVVTGASSDADCRRIHNVGEKIISESSTAAVEYIGVCLGASGSMSRVINKRFTPVTHPLMAKAAPGQLTAQELMDIRLEKHLISSKQFFLFGTPISKSMSPAMHNAAYKALLLPHQYSLAESADVSTYKTVLESENFGGASVTIPHKESIIPYLAEIEGAAKEIGAVNTIVPVHYTENGKSYMKLVGYNTDWLGIFRPILTKLHRRSASWTGLTDIGIVVGAGGTARAACYATKRLGLKLVVVNRSPEKGLEIAEKFGGIFLKDLSLDELRKAGLDKFAIHTIISTVPYAANYSAPEELLRTHRPVVLDVVYSPVRTALIQQALDLNCLCVQGATMLFEQAMEQFQLWNERRAPRDVMEKAVYSGIEIVDRDILV